LPDDQGGVRKPATVPLQPDPGRDLAWQRHWHDVLTMSGQGGWFASMLHHPGHPLQLALKRRKRHRLPDAGLAITDAERRRGRNASS
jgi:hypothetical protein